MKLFTLLNRGNSKTKQSFQNKLAAATAPMVSTRFTIGLILFEYQNNINTDNSKHTSLPATFFTFLPQLPTSNKSESTDKHGR